MGCFDVHFIRKTAFNPRQTYAIRANYFFGLGTTLPSLWQDCAKVMAKLCQAYGKNVGLQGDIWRNKQLLLSLPI